MKMGVNCWIAIYNFIQRFAPSVAHMIREFKVGEPTQLKDIAKSIAYLSVHDYDSTILYNKEMKELSDKFDDEVIKKGLQDWFDFY